MSWNHVQNALKDWISTQSFQGQMGLDSTQKKTPVPFLRNNYMKFQNNVNVTQISRNTQKGCQFSVHELQPFTQKSKISHPTE